MQEIERKLQDFCDMDKLRQVVCNWVSSTGNYALVESVDGTVILEEGVKKGEEAFTYPIELANQERYGVLIMRGKNISRPACELLFDALYFYIKERYEAWSRNNSTEVTELERIGRELEDTLSMVGMGTWAILLPENGKPQMFGDYTMNQLLGTPEDMEPEERYEFWHSRIEPEFVEMVSDCVDRMIQDGAAEVSYPWKHPIIGKQYVRCGGTIDFSYRNGIKLKGCHQDITQQVANDLAAKEADNAMKALSTVFASVWKIDAVRDEISIIKEHNIVSKHVDKTDKNAIEVLKFLIEKYVSLISREELLRICDYDKVNEELKEKGVLTFELCLLDSNWERLVVIPLKRDETGRVIELLCSAQEITEDKKKELESQRQLEEANRMAKLQLETIGNAIPGGFKISRNDKIYSLKYVSEQCAAMLGYTVEELLDVTKGSVFEITHPDDIKVELKKARMQYDRGDTYMMKYRIRCKNGEWKYVMDQGRKIYLENGDYEHWSFVLDIDAQEQLNRLLRRERMQYRDAIIRNSIFFFSADLDEGYLKDDFLVFGKTWASEYFGIQIPIHLDKFFEMIDERTVPIVDKRGAIEELNIGSLLELYAEGKSRYEHEYYVKGLDEYHCMDILLRKEENGHVIATVIGKDVTKQRAEMDRAYQEAKRANVAKTEFLARMSHDIRTPINGILGMSRIALECIDDLPKVEDALEKIRVSGEQLELLIKDVLDMSSLESGRTELTREVFDIEKLFYNVRSSVINAGQGRNIKLIPSESEIIHKNVLGSPLHLQRVLLNIMSNAVKYNKENGTIKAVIKEEPISEDSSIFHMMVQDTGIGMSKSFMEKMYEPFTREHKDAGTKYQGTGLGMSIMKELIDLMGGTIRVESEVNVGTTIYVDMPFTVVAEGNISEDEEKAKTDIMGMKLLLVEDNPINAEIAQFILEKSGAKVTLCQNGAEAVQIFEESNVGSFDVILMDIMMPVMDGIEATKQIRSSKKVNAKTIPIIAMTANAFTEDVKKTKEAGMNGHLAKPLNPKKMLEAIGQFQ